MYVENVVKNVLTIYFFLLHSGVFAITTLFIPILYKRHSLKMWYTPENLQQIRLLGFLGLIAGLVGAAAYIAIAASVHEGNPSRKSLFHRLSD